MAKKIEKEPHPVLRSDTYQANPLLQARKEFNTQGMRLFMLGLRGLNPHFSEKDKYYDEKFPEMFVPTNMLVKLFGGNTKYLHDLKAECKKLFDTVVELNREDGGFTLMHLFNKLEYEPQQGLYLQFDELMRPYLLDLLESKGYTKIEVEQIFPLTSPYAIRLVEIMLQYQNLPESKKHRVISRRLTIDELRFMLNVPNGTYDNRFDNFKSRILKSPIDEINKKTVYRMEYTLKKTGTKVTGIEFRMDISAVPLEEIDWQVAENALVELRHLGFSDETAMEIWRKCEGTDDCLKRIEMAKSILHRQKKKVVIGNELGFLRQAIEENWKSGTKIKMPALPPTSEVIKGKKNPPKPIRAQEVKKDGELTEAEVRNFEDWLRTEGTAKFVPYLLEKRGLTLEEFTQKYLHKRP